MRFEKWQAAGNAYLVIERGELPAPLTPPRVQRICHADLGAGSDGILVLDPVGPGHVRVQILNPDGSAAEFSGNGSRIAVGYVADRDRRTEVTLETPKGTVAGTVDGGSVTVSAVEDNVSAGRLFGAGEGMKYIAIEVKGRATIGDVELSENEYTKACNLRDRYWPKTAVPAHGA